MIRFRHLLALALALAMSGLLSCRRVPAPVPENFEVRRDVNYAGTANGRQTLDLFLPRARSERPRPLIVFIHGGGWTSGDKADAFVERLYLLIKDGAFAGASLNYRLTREARWPQQMYDCKAAIRWLRAHAAELNIDPEKIGVVGGSAGGHLALLLGTSGGVPELEGTLGAHAGVSSRVRCVLNLCGPTNFLTIGDHPGESEWNKASSIGGKLLGGAIPELKETARAASPITYITPDDPPVLSVHGTKDMTVPFAQAVELSSALKKAGVPQALITGQDGGHVFFRVEISQRERLFFEKWLLGRDHPAAMQDMTVDVASKN